MVELYINTYDTLTPNQICIGQVWGEDKQNRTLALKCIREATKEEYLKFVEEKNLMHMVKRSIDNEELKFYLMEILD